MGPAFGGGHLDANHSVGAVFFFEDTPLGERLEKTGPAGAGIEFVIGGKECFSVDDIHINAGRMVIPVSILKGRFCGGITGHRVLFGGEFGAKFFFVHGGAGIGFCWGSIRAMGEEGGAQGSYGAEKRQGEMSVAVHDVGVHDRGRGGSALDLVETFHAFDICRGSLADSLLCGLENLVCYNYHKKDGWQCQDEIPDG